VVDIGVMPISTSTAITISQSELTRANRALTDLDASRTLVTALQTQVVNLQAQSASQVAQIAVLQARIEELTRPPVVVPPVVVPPVVVPPVVIPPVTGARTNIYVDGKTLRTPKGKPFVARGIELMYGPSSASNAARVCATVKALGANTISPLFQPGQSNVSAFRGLLDAAKAAGLVVGFNCDHFTNGVSNPPLNNRQILCQPSVVALINQYDNVFLECEVETVWNQSPADWKSDVLDMVADFRNAGLLKQPIKVGSPDGGRNCRIPLTAGRDVRAVDSNVIFTWQAYWGTNTAPDWTYQGENDFPKGIVGTLAAADEINASGLCFLVGLDAVDDIGATGYQDLAARLDFHGVGWQWWALSGDGNLTPNNLVTDNLRIETITTTGRNVKAILETKLQMVDFS
jgi:hypothetical protein